MGPDPGSRPATRYGVARTLSKLGLASRSAAANWVRSGRVTINGHAIRDPEFPVVQGRDRLTLDGRAVEANQRLYLMLNKPRGLVTTAADEHGRQTVYHCFDGAGLPWLAPVGRLDKASEGLLLFSNDPEWAARITDPATGPDKTYQVQVDTIPGPTVLARLAAGVDIERQRLGAKSVEILRTGQKNAWLQIVLEEGRNRHIRRLLEAHDIGVLRLIRIAIGQLALDQLPKGQWRWLDNGDLARIREMRVG